MRKLLSGYLFRTIKSPVMWALLFLSVIASIYFSYAVFKDYRCITVIRSKNFYYIGNNDEVFVYAGNVKQYRFESLGLSAYDLVRLGYEPIPQESFDLYQNEPNSANVEEYALIGNLTSMHFASSILAVLIIPSFFGMLFRDGTIKNLVACGHSRRKIYLSALVYTFLLDLLMITINIFVFIGFCIYYEWIPPVYLPMALVTLLLEIFIVFNVSAFVVSALFVSAKRTVAVIAGFFMLVYILYPYENPVLMFYNEHRIYSSANEAEHDEWKRIFDTYGLNVFENKADLLTLDGWCYYDGRVISSPEESDLPEAVRTAIVFLIYLDPAILVRGDIGSSWVDYYYYKGGTITVGIVANVIWILASTAIGLVVFKKREVKG